jgi:hypothetical protein
LVFRGLVVGLGLNHERCDDLKLVFRGLVGRAFLCKKRDDIGLDGQHVLEHVKASVAGQSLVHSESCENGNDRVKLIRVGCSWEIICGEAYGKACVDTTLRLKIYGYGIEREVARGHWLVAPAKWLQPDGTK